MVPVVSNLAFLSFLPALTYSQTVTSVSCDGTNMNIVIESASTLSGWELKNCDASYTFPTNGDGSTATMPNGAVIDTSVSGQYSVSFDPYGCAAKTTDQTDLKTYDVTTEIAFGSASVVDGVNIFSGSNVLTASCSFENSYTVSSSLGSVTASENAIADPFDGQSTLDFALTITDDTYSTASSGSYTTGEKIYMKLGDNKNFNFAGSNFWYAPRSCRVSDDSDSANLFADVLTNDGTCGLDLVDFTVGYDVATAQWRMFFTSFMFGASGTANLSITCTIDLCHKSVSGNVCGTQATSCGIDDSICGAGETFTQGSCA